MEQQDDYQQMYFRFFLPSYMKYIKYFKVQNVIEKSR